MIEKFEPYREGDRIPFGEMPIEPFDITITFRGRQVRYVVPVDPHRLLKPRAFAQDLDHAVRKAVEDAVERLVDSDPPPAGLADRVIKRRDET